MCWCYSNDVQTFRAAYAKYGAGRYVGLTVGNEVCCLKTWHKNSILSYTGQ